MRMQYTTSFFLRKGADACPAVVSLIYFPYFFVIPFSAPVLNHFIRSTFFSLISLHFSPFSFIHLYKECFMFQSLFLTSSPCSWPPPPGTDAPFLLREDEGFLSALKKRAGSCLHLLLIASSPDTFSINDGYALDFGKGFRASGWPSLTSAILDSRNCHAVRDCLASADIVLLCGGHVPTQNAFFQRIHLRECLQDYSGIILGISAGSMNAAKTVYAHPEEPGESEDPQYVRFLPGLGLTDLHILPHLNENRHTLLDGKRIYEDIAFPDSYRMPMLAIPDGSYVLSESGHETLYGEGYLIQNGRMTQVGVPFGSLKLS